MKLFTREQCEKKKRKDLAFYRLLLILLCVGVVFVIN
jgi:hypothetical protein